MHVLHYVPFYDNPKGGREIFVRDLVQHLRTFGIKQTVVTYSSENKQGHETDAADLSIIYLRAKQLGGYPMLFGLSRILRDKKYDIIHIHGYGEYAGDLTCLLKRLGLLNSHLILTTHGISGLKNAYLAIDKSSGFGTTQRLKRISHLVYDHLIGRLILGAYDRIIVLSDEEKYYLSKITLITNKCRKIPIAVNDIFFDEKYASKERTIILYAGRIDPYKGLNTLVVALKTLLSKEVDVKCVIVGKDFGYKQRLEKVIVELGLQSIVSIKEFVRQDELARYYYSSIVTVLPSMSEGFPLVLVESMATGTPFISTPVGAIPELVESSSGGLLMQFGDSKSLAETISRLIHDQKFWLQLSSNAKRSSLNYTWKKLAKVYHQLYLELANGNHR